jgi:hypothetical protein
VKKVRSESRGLWHRSQEKSRLCHSVRHNADRSTTHRHGRLPRLAAALRTGAAAAATLLILLSGNALADSKKPASKTSSEKLYKWVDENGIVHYGDHVPPEYAKNERRY